MFICSTFALFPKLKHQIFMTKRLKFLTAALLVMFAAAVQAQVTTSSMSGRVSDTEGAVIGATVIATHEPSGTTYGTVTNMGGPFQLERYARGRTLHGRDFLRGGTGTSTTSNITLSLGENYVLNVVLSEEATTLDEGGGDGTSYQVYYRENGSSNEYHECPDR